MTVDPCLAATLGDGAPLVELRKPVSRPHTCGTVVSGRMIEATAFGAPEAA